MLPKEGDPLIESEDGDDDDNDNDNDNEDDKDESNQINNHISIDSLYEDPLYEIVFNHIKLVKLQTSKRTNTECNYH